MASPSDTSGSRVFLIMALFVIVGMPFVAVLWESLNHLLALDFSPRLWIAVPAAVVLGGILFVLARTVTRSFSP